MKTFLYDGSFTGFMTLIYWTFKDKIKPAKIFKKDDYPGDLFSETVEIKTDGELADKVIKSAKDKLSARVFRQAYYAFLSEFAGIELAIFDYLYLGFAERVNLKKNWTEKSVLEVKKVARKVSRERHRFKGLLRFRELADGILYGPFKPDYNISGLLAPHFAARLTGEQWIIHDLGRKLATIYNGRSWIEISDDLLPELELSQEETGYQEIWQEFFRSIAIDERYNPELQANFIPYKYRDYLLEFENQKRRQ
ncbi:MAG: TIGR03915 family putative DNA repair protein [Halarsenatibacteraceae bacterium]